MGGPWGELPVLPTWPCEAYGAGGVELGILCFMAAAGARVCGSRLQCHESMAAKREQAHARMTAGAERGDPVFIALAAEFTRPDLMLGGAEPIGPWCPECGEPPSFTAGPDGTGSAFCASVACRILMWDPTQTYAAMLEQGVKVVDLSED